jgi:hypothetical protein
MSKNFSPSDAALSIFSFAKMNPRFVLKYMLYSGVVGVFNLFVLGISGAFEFSLAAEKLGNHPSEEQVLAVFKNINAPVMFLGLLLTLVIMGILTSFALRKLVRNQELNPIGINFGQEEINIILGNLAISGIIIGGVILSAIFGKIIGSIVKIGDVISIVCVILFLIFILGRIGIWGVMSFVKGNVGIKAAFQFTKTNFWSFVGAYSLGATIFIVAMLFIRALLTILFKNILPADLISFAPQSNEDLFKVGTIIFQFTMSFVASYGSLALICVGAYAYHQIEAKSE